MADQKFNLGTFDLNLVRTFITLIEERSTVGAARRLFLSQPTVSGALGRLRELLDDELLVRNGRNLEPTVRALELLAAIKPHFEAITAALAENLPFNPAQDARIFRLGCTDAVAFSALPHLSATMRRQAPHCSLVIRMGDYRALPAMLASGEISTALGYMRDDPPATAKVRIARHSPWVVIRDRDRLPISGISDFCARPHALVTPLGDLTGFVDDKLRELGLHRRVVLGLSSFALLLAAIPQSDLIATVPDFVAGQMQAMGGFAIDPCPVVVPPVTNTLAWRAVTDRDPAEKWFRTQLLKAFQAIDI